MAWLPIVCRSITRLPVVHTGGLRRIDSAVTLVRAPLGNHLMKHAIQAGARLAHAREHRQRQLLEIFEARQEHDADTLARFTQGLADFVRIGCTLLENSVSPMIARTKPPISLVTSTAEPSAIESRHRTAWVTIASANRCTCWRWNSG
jgi:hypothetical protein